MKLEETLDKIHKQVTANIWLQIFTVFTRLLLAIGFIPPSIKKIMHEPFTSLPDSNPVGHYFNALLETGFYYEFIGWGQLIAAILLLFPRTAHLGALLFLPIIANIAVLTTSVGFKGTWVVTILMCLAATYLVFWDYDRLKPVIFSTRISSSSFFKRELFLLPVVFTVLAALGVCFLALNGIANVHKAFFTVLITISIIGFIFGLICAIHHKFMSIGELKSPSDRI